MADNDRWLQDALDSWLSPEPGTGPAGDDSWRERTGYFHSAWRPGGQAAPPAAPAPPATAAPPRPAAVQPSPDDRYEADRAGLRTAMTAFMDRLRYAFPSIPAMSVSDIAAAGGWIADMERRVMEAGAWAVLHKGRGRAELSREVDDALSELAQLKQAYALQRGRIEQGQQAEVARINRDTADFVREQDEWRRNRVKEADDHSERLRQKTAEEQQRRRDREHRDFIAYLRDEEVIRFRIEPE
jgi:hypothetical protein